MPQVLMFALLARMNCQEPKAALQSIETHTYQLDLCCFVCSHKPTSQLRSWLILLLWASRQVITVWLTMFAFCGQMLTKMVSQTLT